jgi:hypothetical protein
MMRWLPGLRKAKADEKSRRCSASSCACGPESREEGRLSQRCESISLGWGPCRKGSLSVLATQRPPAEECERVGASAGSEQLLPPIRLTVTTCSGDSSGLGPAGRVGRAALKLGEAAHAILRPGPYTLGSGGWLAAWPSDVFPTRFCQGSSRLALCPASYVGCGRTTHTSQPGAHALLVMPASSRL